MKSNEKLLTTFTICALGLAMLACASAPKLRPERPAHFVAPEIAFSSTTYTENGRFNQTGVRYETRYSFDAEGYLNGMTRLMDGRPNGDQDTIAHFQLNAKTIFVVTNTKVYHSDELIRETNCQYQVIAGEVRKVRNESFDSANLFPWDKKSVTWEYNEKGYPKKMVISFDDRIDRVDDYGYWEPAKSPFEVTVPQDKEIILCELGEQ